MFSRMPDMSPGDGRLLVRTLVVSQCLCLRWRKTLSSLVRCGKVGGASASCRKERLPHIRPPYKFFSNLLHTSNNHLCLGIFPVEFSNFQSHRSLAVTYKGLDSLEHPYLRNSLCKTPTITFHRRNTNHILNVTENW